MLLYCYRSQKLENVSIALEFLEREGITLVNIDSTDIVDCKLKLILGLIWTLILHYAISMPMWDGPPLGGLAEEKTPKQRLMDWVKDKAPGVKNFGTDWNDGKAIGMKHALKNRTSFQFHKISTPHCNDYLKKKKLNPLNQ